MAEATVKIVHGALDEENGKIILRGRIDPDSFSALLVDDYQREVLPASTINDLKEGFKSGSVPDVDLGMRGQRWRSPKDQNDVFILQDLVYIVDGLQRITAAQQLMLEGFRPRLGATIHFDTTREWENERFKILNADRNKLSPNVLARNMRDKSEVINTLYLMSVEDNGFALHNHVCWNQRSQRTHLVTAVTLLKTLGYLHSHLGEKLYVNRVFELGTALQQVFDRVGRNVFRHNVKAFFAVVEQCWGIRSVTYREEATHLHSTFLWALAKVFSNHELFWNDCRLIPGEDFVRRLKTFPVHDPVVRQLSGARGLAMKQLYLHFIDHLNHGRRTRRLQERTSYASDIGKVPLTPSSESSS